MHALQSLPDSKDSLKLFVLVLMAVHTLESLTDNRDSLKLFVAVLASAHQHRNWGVMHDVIADAAHDGSPKLAKTAGASNNKRRLLLACDADDYLPWFSGTCSKLPWNLKKKKRQKRKNEKKRNSVACTYGSVNSDSK